MNYARRKGSAKTYRYVAYTGGITAALMKFLSEFPKVGSIRKQDNGDLLIFYIGPKLLVPILSVF